MNLIIDVGNTSIKLAVFNRDALEEKHTIEKEDFHTALVHIQNMFPDIDCCILSKVGHIPETDLQTLKDRYTLVILSPKLKVPFENRYETPNTLGVDRIALVSAAAVQFPKKNVLIIDAGSCITYDFINAENEYLGGGISPGIQMRYKAMHTFTANLPLLDRKSVDRPYGDSTENSMHIGVFQGVTHELEGFIDQYIENFGNLTVILTGGDAHFLRDRLKNDIFANSNFLLEGLNHILEINKDSC